MRIAFLVQRYGLDVNGGAELHCRLVAERLAKDHEVEVLSSCALDYISWQDHYPPGEERMNNVLLRRFRVKQPRDERRFGLISNEVFSGPTSLERQRLWLREQGPYVRDLMQYLRANIDRYDILIPYSFRYYHSHECVRLFGHKSILVPTAEPDPAVELAVFNSTFREPRVILYNTPESKNLIENAQHNYSVPSIVTGVGIEERNSGDVRSVLAKYSLLSQPYIIYIGRIDKNKGCDRLFDYFTSFISLEHVPKPYLVLLGSNVIDIPDHPMIRHLGFVSAEDKLALLKGSLLLVMPSHLESLSIVLLEAWACNKPVLANGESDVLRGQCTRANGGLCYRSKAEFIVCLNELLTNDFLRSRLGSLGNKYFRINYNWGVITQKYERAFEIVLRGEGGRAAGSVKGRAQWP